MDAVKHDQTHVSSEQLAFNKHSSYPTPDHSLTISKHLYQLSQNHFVLYKPGVGAARFKRPTFVSTAEPNTLDGSCSAVSANGYHAQTQTQLTNSLVLTLKKITQITSCIFAPDISTHLSTHLYHDPLTTAVSMTAQRNAWHGLWYNSTMTN